MDESETVKEHPPPSPAQVSESDSSRNKDEVKLESCQPISQQQQQQQQQQQPQQVGGQQLSEPMIQNGDVNGSKDGNNTSAVTFSESPSSKLIPPRQRASMLPKPEVGPKPSYLRTSLGGGPKRQLPMSNGPSSLNIMTTSLPSPFASSPSPSDSSESSRSIWGHRGSFTEAMASNKMMSPGTPGSSHSSSSSSGNGSPVKTGSPPSPNSKIPSPTHVIYNNTLHSLSPSSMMSQSLVLDPAASPKTCSRNHSATNTIEVVASPTRTGNLSKLTAKASGTASMLRSTLRRMTRLAVSTSHSSIDKQQQLQQPHLQLPATPSPVRGSSPKHQQQDSSSSPSPNTRKLIGPGPKTISPNSLISVNHIQRSRSFRDAVGYGSSDTLGSRSSQYGPSSINTVQQYRSNSLRRSHRNKDLPFQQPLQQQQQQSAVSGPGVSQTMRASIGLQRSGTNGTLDRGSNVRRSNSTAGGGSNTAGRRVRDQNVRKSRGVQTLLTKDTYMDEDPGADNVNPSVVEFTVYLPDLLDSGGADQGVETHVIEPTEPIDVRRNRQLTLDNMRLNRELEKVRSQLSETDAVKRELKSAKVKLEEEQRTRIRIEQQLDQHNEKVMLIAQSMDTVEREFEVRDGHIASLEAKLAKAEAELVSANDVIKCQRAEIVQALALQKTLLLQYQESEIESKELHEFLQAEKYTLAETLKDCESEMSVLKSEIARKQAEILSVEERCGHLVRLGEQRHQEVRMLQAQLKGLDESARSTILAQGAELSTAHVILSELLTLLKSEYPNSANVIEEAPQVKRSGSGFGLADKIKSLGRSLISRTPDKEVAVVTEKVVEDEDDLMTGCLLNDPTLQNLSEAIIKRQKSEEIIGNGFSDLLSYPDEDGPSLESKLELLKICMEQLITDLKNKNNAVRSNGNGVADSKSDNKPEISENGKMSNGTNGTNGHAVSKSSDVSSLDPEMFDLNGTTMMMDDNEKKEEIIAKFLRHRKILMSNCEQAESEIKRVDEIYHDTINHVLEVLDSLPRDTATHPELLKLKTYLEEENSTETLVSQKRNNQNGSDSSNNKTSKSDNLIPTNLEQVLAGKRQILHLTETTAQPTLNQSL